MTEEREDAGLDAAPEGGTGRARPDTEDAPREEETPPEERAPEDERAVTDPDAEQPDPQSGPATGT
jgi:hypothetical protein